ncbi:unnamed protein product [Trifolium pratense]|uniref:Uncharacterized protein n=1 Tax=Trifolium pratense TaxID=57577 RepID=A0ACB0L6M6_TRIPR|nr:unnamed protein product [Trifolium pratense]
MERKMLFGMHFFLIFLIVILTAQEAVMQIEASEILVKCFGFEGPCRHNNGEDTVVCHIACLLMHKIMSAGFCVNDKCMCEVGG